MKKVLKNFYVRGSLLVLLVFFVFYFVFSAAFSAFTPTIAQRVEALRDEAMAAVTGGRETSAMEDVTLVDGVSQVLAVSDGGYIVTATAQGAEGPITLSVGLDAGGAVTGIVVTDSIEAPEYGGKALQESYLSGYLGLSDSEGVAAYTGATYTSQAIRECVDKAFLQYGVINGEAYDAPLGEEEVMAGFLSAHLGEGYAAADTAEKADTILEVYTSGEGCVMLAEANGAGGPIRLMIYIDNGGVVQDISALSHSEPLGRGDQYLSDAYLFFYEGYSSYGYFDGGSGSYVFDKFDDTNLAIGKMLMGAVEQFRMLGAA